MAVVFVGYLAMHVPTVLVRLGLLSTFDAVRGVGPLLFLSSGCSASRQVYADWTSDPNLRELATPVTRAPRSGGEGSFEFEVCDIVRARLEQRGAWWIEFVDRRIACESLWRGAHEFSDRKYLVSWPQFATEDRMVRSHNAAELLAIGIVEVSENGRRRYRAASERRE
jgi:hypothetical protein